MTLPGRTYKDQRKHRRKVMGTPEGLEEHEKRKERRADRGDWVREEMKEKGNQHHRPKKRGRKNKRASYRYNKGQS